MRVAAIVLVLLTLPLAPLALATWRAYGASEPDTTADRDGGLMWGAPSGSAVDRVYFNVAAQELVGGGGPSPNSATLGSRVEAEPLEGFTAILGVWVDCNHDGYVGLADGALLEYEASASAALGRPIDTSICPVLDDSVENAGRTHNGGGWITELTPIGPVAPRGTEPDLRAWTDPGARIWGDNLAPGAVVPEYCGGPRGLPDREHASHTGGMLSDANCLAGDAAQPLASAWAAGGPADAAIPGDASGPAVVTVADCDATPVAEPLGLAVRPPRAGVETGGTIAGTLRDAYDGAPLLGACDPARAGGDPYLLLDAVETTGANRHRTQPDVLFNYEPKSRFDCETLGPQGCGMPWDFGAPAIVGPAAPVEAMLPRFDRRPAMGAGGWTAQPYAAPVIHAGNAPRWEADRETLDAQVAAGDWWSFYATIGVPGLQTPGGLGTYGVEWCRWGIGVGAPLVPGWDCDPQDWQPSWPKVGDAFNLRDIDCYDGTLLARASPVNPIGSDVGPRSVSDTLDPGDACA